MMRPAAMLMLLGLALPGAAPVRAQSRPSPRPPAALKKLDAGLTSPESTRVVQSLQGLGKLKHPAAVERLQRFLHAGQPDALADRAIDALGATGLEEALPLLSELTHHRRSGARRHAYSAIAAIADDSVPALLAKGLRDSDAGVRGEAARWLGELGAQDELPILFRALSLGVPEAAAAIGKLGDEASLAKYDQHLERQPLTVMLAGYEAFLGRTDLPEKAKLGIVGRLGEVAGVTVKRFLESLLAKLDWKNQLRLRHAVKETARRIEVLVPKPTHTKTKTGGAP